MKVQDSFLHFFVDIVTKMSYIIYVDGGNNMFEVGMGIIRQYSDYTAKGEITSVHDDANGETLVTVMYDDGAVKTYTENCVEQNLGRRMIVTQEVIW